MTWRELVKSMQPGKKYTWNDLVKIQHPDSDKAPDIRAIRATIVAAGSYIDKDINTGNYSITSSGAEYRVRMGWDNESNDADN